MECIEINVQKEIAEKWRKASSEMKEKIERKIEKELTNELLQDLKKKPKPIKKKWNYLGSVSIGQKTDAIHIRDFAYDD